MIKDGDAGEGTSSAREAPRRGNQKNCTLSRVIKHKEAECSRVERPPPIRWEPRLEAGQPSAAAPVEPGPRRVGGAQCRRGSGSAVGMARSSSLVIFEPAVSWACCGSRSDRVWSQQRPREHGGGGPVGTVAIGPSRCWAPATRRARVLRGGLLTVLGVIGVEAGGGPRRVRPRTSPPECSPAYLPFWRLRGARASARPTAPSASRRSHPRVCNDVGGYAAGLRSQAPMAPDQPKK